MTIELPQKTEIGMGYAFQSDPFQSGREAAQLARSRYPDRKPDLVLAFAPSNIHFQDFIEGVRLVTGEDALVGIPVTRVATNELVSPQATAVVLLYAGEDRCTIGCTKFINGNTLASLTSLNTQFRSLRGNTKNQYEHQGVLFFENISSTSKTNLFDSITAEMGLEPWILKLNPKSEDMSPIMCFDQVLKPGIIGIEYLSERPWGFGHVNLRAFKDHPNILQQAMTTAVRDAQHNLNGIEAKFGFLLFNLPESNVPEQNLQQIFTSAKDIVSDLPLIGLFSCHPNLRYQNKRFQSEDESVLSVLIPG